MELVNFGQYSNVATLAALVKNDRGVVSNRLYYCLRSDHVNEDRFFFAGGKKAYFVTFDESLGTPFYIFATQDNLMSLIYSN
jgi:hypothetical protein